MELLEAHSQTVYTSRIYMPYCFDSIHWAAAASTKQQVYGQQVCFWYHRSETLHFWSSANIVLRPPIFLSEIDAFSFRVLRTIMRVFHVNPVRVVSFRVRSTPLRP